ncbi:hypothetical protein D3C86_1507480 [compost metagenome]
MLAKRCKPLYLSPKSSTENFPGSVKVKVIVLSTTSGVIFLDNGLINTLLGPSRSGKVLQVISIVTEPLKSKLTNEDLSLLVKVPWVLFTKVL